ncbi:MULTISPECIES: ABC transporter substrate-binding protein [unclassified Mesorhizobium]|uniref:ABC transporter substrate-binding protein n=1 Tax=unclassified Mesorhizobium TaxID=325217 RepID=UPI000F765CBA|nr:MULTISPECIES: ABC transporter substrate-binding protein [unclassified Mesorhizobium]AZO18072.1 ABC transporter substrate-binding protein [Mesorhizobium sp. M2A.F.Ca.ET.043.05.1.1]RVB72059.1 ABC transporter substrate-binding protein [Mesorhizobium sp. M6A.T.Cr.TU.014.01.1.1]RWP97800.1 MAG: ABC transporter substrate-binding protein [Mesorhizobium sp.]RWP98728.1 MAG: ABC transporter substrate-binding protein [Mesorhizobium sp.]
MTCRSILKISAFLLLLLGVASPGANATEVRTITDMAGRRVVVPAEVERVATMGSVPPLNSLLFAVGASDRLVSGLPPRFGENPRWTFQKVFAPQLVDAPLIETQSREPDLEAIIALQPDVILTTYPAIADAMARVGVPAVVIEWQEPDDVKTAMDLIGGLLGKEKEAAAYVDYFDRTLARVSAISQSLAVTEKPRVLYFEPETISQPHLIAEWWIRQAGGVSVSDDGRSQEVLSFNIEQVLAWNPDIILVPQLKDVEKVIANPLLKDVRAVATRRVFPLPVVAHTWGNRTAEQPLTVLWAARTLNPEVFGEIDLEAEVKRFYATIFAHSLDDKTVAAILDPTTEPPY